MGVVLSHAEVAKGLEPVTCFDVNMVRQICKNFEDLCPMPALWERAFHELLPVFPSAEACSRAFMVLDTDGNGLVDARELLGALAVISKGHLKDRMALVFDIFDLNGEKQMSFYECLIMLRRVIFGLRKMTGIFLPPEKIIHNMVKEIWVSSEKKRDARIAPEEWYDWWAYDSTIRSALKMFTWRPDDHKGLPRPDELVSVDYTRNLKAIAEEELVAKHVGNSAYLDAQSRPGSSSKRRAYSFSRPASRASTDDDRPGSQDLPAIHRMSVASSVDRRRSRMMPMSLNARNYSVSPRSSDVGLASFEPRRSRMTASVSPKSSDVGGLSPRPKTSSSNYTRGLSMLTVPRGDGIIPCSPKTPRNMSRPTSANSSVGRSVAPRSP